MLESKCTLELVHCPELEVTDCKWQLPIPIPCLGVPPPAATVPCLLPAGSLRLAAAQPPPLGLALLWLITESGPIQNVANLIPRAIHLGSPSHASCGKTLSFIQVARKNVEPGTAE